MEANPPNDQSGTDAREQFAAGRRRAERGPEESLWKGGYSAKDMVGSFVFLILISIAAIVAGVFFPVVWIFILLGLPILWVIQLIRMGWMKMNVAYELTNRRFMHEHGVISRSIDRVEVIDIDDVTVIQGIVDRMLNVGTIRITSSDRTHPTLLLHGIDNPRQVAQLLDDARQRERDRRGVYIESI